MPLSDKKKQTNDTSKNKNRSQNIWGLKEVSYNTAHIWLLIPFIWKMKAGLEGELAELMGRGVG